MAFRGTRYPQEENVKRQTREKIPGKEPTNMVAFHEHNRGSNNDTAVSVTYRYGRNGLMERTGSMPSLR